MHPGPHFGPLLLSGTLMSSAWGTGVQILGPWLLFSCPAFPGSQPLAPCPSPHSALSLRSLLASLSNSSGWPCPSHLLQTPPQ